MQTLFGRDVIKSISFDEGEIIKSIVELHCPNYFELDPCYSIGRFYNQFAIPKPKHRFDINPQVEGVLKSDARNLPVESNSIQSIMFDPPFLSSSGKSHENKIDGSNIMANRFSVFKTMDDLWEWYWDCLKEFKRVLTVGGALVFKNQDTVSGSKQYFSHCEIMNMAVELGFYPKDLFILLAKVRIIGGNHSIQQHARKFHSYYWVFTNSHTLVKYKRKIA